MGLKAAYRAGYGNRPGWRIRFSYDAEIVERLKASIPHTQRAWFQESSEWWVSQEYENVILALLPTFAAYLNQPQLL